MQDIEGHQRMEQRQTAGAKKMTKGSPVTHQAKEHARTHDTHAGESEVFGKC